jgi:hypothetical protein
MLRGAQTDVEPVSYMTKEMSYLQSAKEAKRIESGMQARTGTPTPRSPDTGTTEEEEEEEMETGMRYMSYMSSMSDARAPISDTR